MARVGCQLAMMIINFQGINNGNSHSIDGLYINRPTTDFLGLFGCTNSAVIENLGVTSFEIIGNQFAGGLVGMNDHTSLTNCYSSGSMSGISYYAGGLVGYNRYSTLTNCYSTCSISGVNYVGGLIGYATVSTISNCFSSNRVTGTNNYAGGLIGFITGSDVSNCYSTSSVNGLNQVGGLVGRNENTSTISSSYSIGSVSGSTQVGGLVGAISSSTVSNSFWDRETSGQTTSEGGTGKTTADMQTLTTYTDVTTEGLDEAWDFVDNPNDDTGEEDHWDFNSVIPGYSYLSWQTGVSVFIAAGNTDSHSFSPAGVSLQFTSGNAQDIELGIFRADSLPTVVGELPDGVQNLSPRHWTATLTGASSGTYTITFDITGLSGINECTSLRVLKRENNTSPWVDVETLGGVVSYDCPNTLTVVGLTGFSTFVLGGGSENPLPVELAGFSGSSTKQGIELSWKTTSETDNAGFVINRNGIEIASYKNTEALKGEGTTSQAHSYTYVDADVSLDETHIYELVSVDYSGTRHKYRKTVEVTVTEALEIQKVYEYALQQNYPNPFNPSTTINFTMKQAGIATFKVYDMLGRNVFEKQLQAGVGANTFTFNAENLTSGVYFYQLNTEGFSKTKKMMLLK